MTARSTWNDLGFWYEDVVASRGDRSSEAAPQADRVLLLGRRTGCSWRSRPWWS